MLIKLIKVAAFLALLALFVFVGRVALLRGAAHGGLLLAGGELIAMDGLQVGWGGLSVDTLIIRLGEDGSLQLAKGVDLRYSLSERRIRSLHVNELQLAPVTVSSNQDSGADLDPVRILYTFIRLPLDSAQVDRLLWPGQAPVMLALNREGKAQQLRLVQGQKCLTLTATEPASQVIDLAARLSDARADLAILDASLEASESGYHLEARAQLTAAVLGLFAAPLLVADSGAGLDLEFRGELSDAEPHKVSLDVVARLQAAELAVGNISLLGNEAELQAVLQWDSGQLMLELAPGSLWRSASISSGDLRLEAPALSLARAATIELSPLSVAATLPAADLSLPVVTLDQWHAATTLRLSKLRASYSTGTGELVADGNLATESLNIRRPGQWLPIMALNSTFALQGQNLSARGEVGSDRRKRLFEFDVRHDLRRMRGSLGLSTGPLIFGEGDELLGSYFSWWPFEFDLRAGRSETEAQLNWSRAGLVGSFRQELAEISGFYQDIGFLGVDAALAGSFAYPDGLVIDKDGLIRVHALDVGVPVDDIEIRFSAAIRPLAGEGARRDKLHLSGFDASLFGGRVSIGEHLLVRHRPPGFLTLRFEEVELEQLLAATGYTAVEGQGSISGQLPLRVDGQGLTMRDGRFEALAPGGVLRYRAAPGGAPPGTAVALVQQALGNYHYNSLRATANYGASGDLAMKLKLDGSNPDLNQGQRVILNLTLEDNIPALLKSLQAGRRIEELVDQYIGDGAGAPRKNNPSENQ